MFTRFVRGCFLATVIVSCSTSAFAGKVELTTYYPAPYGEYTTLKSRGTGQALSTGNLDDSGATGCQLLLDEASGAGYGGGAVVFAGNGDKFAAIKGNYQDSAGNGTGWLQFLTRTLTSDTTMTPKMTIVNSGNVGIGTAAPAAKLTIGNNIATGFLDSYSEYQLLLWDSAATAGNSYGIGIKGANMVFNSGAGGYSFDAGGTATRMVIDTAGNVGIGVATPTGQFHVVGGIVNFGTSVSGDSHWIHHNGTGNLYFGRTTGVYGPTTAWWAVLDTAGRWIDASSVQYKTDIRTLSAKESLAAVMGLRPIEYRSKSDVSTRHVGFIAEEVPDLVATNDRKGLSSMDIAAVLTKVVQQQQKEIESLKSELKQQAELLKKEISGFKKEVLELKKR